MKEREGGSRGLFLKEGMGRRGKREIRREEEEREGGKEPALPMKKSFPRPWRRTPATRQTDKETVRLSLSVVSVRVNDA